MATKEPRERLIDRLAQDFKEILRASMPRVDQALEGEGKRQASVSVTAQFGKGRNDEELVQLKPRERIPLPIVEHKLGREDGQLVLL